jgi:hypothetical protein
MSDDKELKIGSETPANMIMQYYPETTDYFVELGVCGCDFGPPGRSPLTKTLAEIAEDKGISVSDMISRIKELIED